jgi:hypothetical protein
MGFWEGTRVAAQSEEIERDERITRDSEEVLPEANSLASAASDIDPRQISCHSAK